MQNGHQVCLFFLSVISVGSIQTTMIIIGDFKSIDEGVRHYSFITRSFL